MIWLYIYVCVCVHVSTCALCLVAQSSPTVCDPMDCSLPGSSVHGDSPGKNTGGGCHAVLQGIFLTQKSNPGLPHFRQTLYRLSHQGSLIHLLEHKWKKNPPPTSRQRAWARLRPDEGPYNVIGNTSAIFRV